MGAKQQTCRLAAVALAALVAGCAAAPPPRFDLKPSAAEVKAAPQLTVLPVSVVQEYLPSGDADLDRSLVGNGEVWGPEITAHLTGALPSKGNKAAVALLGPAEARAKIEAALAAKGRKGFRSSSDGTFDHELFEATMASLAAQNGGTLVVPRLVLRDARVGRGFGDFFSHARWDDVARGVESGGSKVLTVLSGFNTRSSPREITGEITAYSLRVDVFRASGLAYWACGGFEVPGKIGAGMGRLTVTKRENMAELLGDDYRDERQEAIQLAFSPLLGG